MRIVGKAILLALQPYIEGTWSWLSSGFRYNWDRHKALIKFVQKTVDSGNDYVISIDIRKCFDSIPHSGLKKLIRKWPLPWLLKRWSLKTIVAPVIDAGKKHIPTCGTPQGGVLSPLLCYEYVKSIESKLAQFCVIDRYADNILLSCRYSHASEIWSRFEESFKDIDLRIHPKKIESMSIGQNLDPSLSVIDENLGIGWMSLNCFYKFAEPKNTKRKSKPRLRLILKDYDWDPDIFISRSNASNTSKLNFLQPMPIVNAKPNIFAGHIIAWSGVYIKNHGWHKSSLNPKWLHQNPSKRTRYLFSAGNEIPSPIILPPST